MYELMLSYQETARMLYQRAKELSLDDPLRNLLFAEYREVCDVFRQLRSYCKVKGLL